MLDDLLRARGVAFGWRRLAALYAVLTILLLWFRQSFDWNRPLEDAPILVFAAGMMIAGFAFLETPRLVGSAQSQDPRDQHRTLVFIVAVGLALRVALLWSTPAFEDDFYRYLWDGGITANGLNPFSVVPATASTDAAPPLVQELATSAGYVHQRVNRPELRTIYPMVAQALFAVAYLAEPWSLLAWRLVCLTAECITLSLLLLLLSAVGRSRLWVAIYWLNPLVIKELMNSAHMEAIVVPFVLTTALLAMRNRPLAASAMLVLAGAAKVWPLLLAPLVLRPLLGAPKRLVAAAAILLAGSVVLAIPPLIAGLDESAGVVAYANHWQRNGALVPSLTSLLSTILPIPYQDAGSIVRGLVVATACLVAVLLAWRPIADARDFATRAALLVTTVLLLSPAQYPWYLAWVMPFMTLRPIAGMLVATALMPLYYSAFYFRTLGTEHIFDTYLVWLIWVPIWVLLWRERRLSSFTVSSAIRSATPMGR